MNLFQGITAALEALAGDRQHNRLLRMRFPLNNAPADTLMLANRLHAEESLSRDFVYTVEVLSDKADIDPEDVLGKMVTVDMVREDGTLRYFNGYVFEFQFLKTDGGFAFYQMVLEPWMAYLRLRQDNATHQNMTVRQLTEKVFEPYLKRDWTVRSMMSEDPPITYICQYGETDHNLVNRHWEALGWTYRYAHTADGHKLELTDNTTRTSIQIDGSRADMPFQDDAGAMEDDGIHQWSQRGRIRSTKMSLVSFNFKHVVPKMVERISAQRSSSDPELEVYENTGAYGYKSYDQGEPIAQRRVEEVDARRAEFVGRGNDRTAEPGRWFTLSGHFNAAAEQKFLITAVRHFASNNYQDGRDAVSSYVNEIECIPQNVPWRPGRGYNSVQPQIYGPQTATVVGPKGEEIYTDGFGRVKVQFHWDRKGKYDELSSPWVRVMTGWAGSQFGQISLPRIGMEVVVQFLDGNPERPLITGCVYNETHMPPWPLPDNKTQSGILTRSSKGGTPENANAFRFEDKKGQEEVWLHAEKDERIEVEHDESHWVGNDRRKNIDHDETVVIKHDQKITVHNNRSERVDHEEKIRIGDNRTENVGINETISIGRNRKKTVGKNENIVVSRMKTETIGMTSIQNVGMVRMDNVGMAMATTVGVQQTTTVGKTVFVTAGSSIEFVCGQSKLVLTPNAVYIESNDVHVKAGSKVHIDGPGDVLLNSGGAQGAPARMPDDVEEKLLDPDDAPEAPPSEPDGA